MHQRNLAIIGLCLVEAALITAQQSGYGEIKLDTLPEMDAAIALYKRSGFVGIPPYGSHPYPGLVTLGKKLNP